MKQLLIVLMLGWFSNPLYAENNAYYTPKGTVNEQLKEGIDYTKQCINICIHNFAALDIVKDLEMARDKGIRIRIVILEQGINKNRGPLAETLLHRGFDVRVLKAKTGDDQIQDFILLDDRILVTGVYNWLAYQKRNICNDVLFHYDPERIRAYKNTFYALFTEAEAAPLLINWKEWVATNATLLSVTDYDTSDAGQATQDHIPDKEPMATGKSAKPPLETAIFKDFIDISFEELDKQFGKESTLSRSEKNELWKKYKGKYVRWHGIVSYKGMGRVDWNRIGISRQRSRDAEVEIRFDWRMFDKVMNVSVGSPITYTGKLVSRSGINAPYRLDDGNIE
ncbi:MAG: phospholipase D-like domain-containing protein [Candidatus Brocadia sp.]